MAFTPFSGNPFNLYLLLNGKPLNRFCNSFILSKIKCLYVRADLQCRCRTRNVSKGSWRPGGGGEMFGIIPCLYTHVINAINITIKNNIYYIIYIHVYL